MLFMSCEGALVYMRSTGGCEDVKDRANEGILASRVSVIPIAG